jgi:two-component system sensor kinase FixL
MPHAPSAFPADALLATLIATSVDGIMAIDARGTVLLYNQACTRLFGYAPDEVLGRNVKMLMPEPYHGEHDAYLSRYRAGGARHIIGIGRDVTGRRKDGSTFPMYLSVGEGVLDGKPIFVGIVHDISADHARDRRIQELQNDLLHATRAGAMGQMSSAIAHELNQPLTAILASTAAVRRLAEAPDAEPGLLREAAEGATRDAARAGEILRGLRAFVEKRPPSRSAQMLEPLLADAVALAATGAQKARIHAQIEPGLPALLVDRIQLQQVLVNLIRNALEAMAGQDDAAIVIVARREGGDVQITVRDNGPGLPPPVAARLFEPFVTSRADGMGMGLSICRTIIEAHGGRIWAQTPEDGGTAFHILLPAAA